MATGRIDVGAPRATELTISLIDDNGFINSLNGLQAYKGRDFLLLEGSPTVLANSALSDFVDIATIDGWEALTISNVTVPLQADNTKEIVVYVTTHGTIRVFTSTGTTQSAIRFSTLAPRAF